MTAPPGPRMPAAALPVAVLPTPVEISRTAVARLGAVYSAPAGSRPLELDLFTPVGAAARVPAIVWIHDGASQLGSRRLLHDLLAAVSEAGRLVAAGVAIASIDYRPSGDRGAPARADDVRAAVRWIRRHAAALGVDPAAIEVGGPSASLADRARRGERPPASSADAEAEPVKED
ncbi:alpha/beta hydrolase [Demequina sp. SYSU T00192]|uniref:Alpha/beta hydrolase n=1 Tax=Demequina litoralis TaxID=3051660 RepID=A0ABT8G6E7_9MICO|nr:alpha/beta hydrolase [Demequina sp. SYSU T00192]MDN4474696.1 alpha/beta hydrolase [Demequina sp. SYSU T00192]